MLQLQFVFFEICTHPFQGVKVSMPQRVFELSNKHGFSYKKIFIKNARTRWGSWSAKNNLNFNLHLMRLPDKLIDYVILYELSHTVIKDHSKKFWALPDKLVGDAKSLDKRVKEV